jgi:2-C-methyl-D-erythritol 4-phosphate cytidylyltransferase
MGKTALVLAAAGKGTRMGTAESKQYLLLEGEPILMHTLRTFAALDEIDEIVVVAHADDRVRCEALVAEAGFAKPIRFGTGVGERQDSVFVGLQLVSADVEFVLVHDAVRPLITPTDIRACLAEAKQSGAAVLGVPVKDTIKIVDETGRVASTPDRKRLWHIQTPQAFRLQPLIEAHRRAQAEGVAVTDDAMLAEWVGIPVQVVPGSYTNLKITTPEDLAWASFLLSRKETEQ